MIKAICLKRLSVSDKRWSMLTPCLLNVILSAWMFYSYLAPVFNMLNQPDSALYYSRRASAMWRAMGHESIAAAMEMLLHVKNVLLFLA